jgi:hypothetical protein
MEPYCFGQRPGCGQGRDRAGRLAACRLRCRRLQFGAGGGRPYDPASPIDQDRASDQATIRNAVSSADIQELGGQAVPWANSDTGSRGSITELAESSDNGQLCRRFTASRESFDGVALFKGEVCLAGAGAWRIQDFKAL